MNQAPANHATDFTSSSQESKTESGIDSSLQRTSTFASDQTTTNSPSSPSSEEPANRPENLIAPDEDKPNLDLIMKIPVEVQVILGTTRMPVSRLMKLGRNAVIALDRQVGDPIDVVVNGRTVARGEVVLMEDDSSQFGISLTELVGPNECEK